MAQRWKIIMNHIQRYKVILSSWDAGIHNYIEPTSEVQQEYEEKNNDEETGEEINETISDFI